MSQLVADCTKSEYIKFIDKGFSKSEIKSICNSSTNNNKTRWITPSNSKCVAYGGKIENGVCTAT